ncbi:hypothetical protein Dsin_027259 [Dipteronia sinensis]|uniref:EF-hand domain-containing protein n=1 Tax=Dipteronia sinensis TaxID=43782 RepID=A0AAD9ZNF4_9ROSI|nr:hypothetical protein Dsin_027259 [Dipteronia sinensis]
MEELREAAIAYYYNSSGDLQMTACNFFRSIDANGDGSVSLIEFVEFLRQRGYHWISPDLFTELDRNGDGCLDLTMYYMVKTRSVCCRGCRTILKGLYFTCVIRFDHVGDAFDICSMCYGRRTFSHQHNSFLDSYVLLQSRRGTSYGATNLNLAQPSIPQHLVVAPVGQPARIGWLDAFQALEMVFAIGSLASFGCTIM